MGKLRVFWESRKPWQRYAIVAGVGLLVGLILGSMGNPPVAP